MTRAIKTMALKIAEQQIMTMERVPRCLLFDGWRGSAARFGRGSGPSGKTSDNFQVFRLWSLIVWLL